MTPDLARPSTHQLLRSTDDDSEPDMSFDKSASPETAGLDHGLRGSYHMTYMRDYLFNFEERDGGNVLLGDAMQFYIRGMDKVRVQIRDGSSFMLANVRYVEGFLVGLLGILELVKAKYIFLGYHEGTVGNKLWKLDDVTSKVLHEVEFEVEPREDHAFEVEPQVNVDHVAARELFRYREDSKGAAFEVAAVEKIYEHESLTFNDTIACDVISKWNAGLKEDMYAWSMYAWSVKAKENLLGLEIVTDQSGNTLRVSQSRVHNEKLVQTLLEGHSILSLEGSLSGDCNVEKNGKWSHMYPVESQEFQVVYTILDIASLDMDMLDGFDRELQTNVKVFVDSEYAIAKLQHMEGLSTTKVGYMTFVEVWKKERWPKGLTIESKDELWLAGFWVVKMGVENVFTVAICWAAYCLLKATAKPDTIYVQDATHFFVSDLHPRFKEEDLETRFPNALRVQLARDRLTGKSLRRDDGSIDGIDVCRPGYEVSKDTDLEDPSGKRSKDSSCVPVLENLWTEDKMRQFGLSDFTFLPVGICDKRRPQANLGDHMPSRVYETKGRMEATRGH
ncbi:hypothetical protein Tco_1449945 [Tanacetum coccineum]